MAGHLKGDLGLRPFYHQKQARIGAHVFVAFLAYCLHLTLGRRLRHLAPGLTPRSVLVKLATMQIIDVHLPTTDNREVILRRYAPAGARPTAPAGATESAKSGYAPKPTARLTPKLVAQSAALCFIECMTLRVLEKEALSLPPRSRVRLAERIIESIEDYADPELEAAWGDEVERRVRGIKSRTEQGLPAEQVMQEARRALNEARRLPSSRRT